MKSLCKGAAFLLLLVLTVVLVNGVLVPKVCLGDLGIAVLGDVPSSHIDVCFIGSSHFYRNIDPALLWEEQGIAAFDLCNSSQRFPSTYYYLVELLKRQKPSLVVIDVYNFKPSATLKTTLGMNGMPLSRNKYEYLSLLNDQTIVFEKLSMLPTYHDRMDDLSVSDFNPETKTGDLTKHLGYERSYERDESLQVPRMTTSEELGELSPEKVQWVERILALCDENQIDVLALEVPFPGSTHRFFRRQMNSGMLCVEQLGGDVLDAFTPMQDIALTGADFADEHHMNNSGSRKYTSWLGAWLKAHYNLPDRRGETGYARWTEAAEIRRRCDENMAVAWSPTIMEALAYVRDERILIVWLTEKTMPPVEDVGLLTDCDALGKRCAVVFRDGNVKAVIREGDLPFIETFAHEVYAIRYDALYKNRAVVAAPAEDQMVAILLDERLNERVDLRLTSGDPQSAS